MMVKKTTTCRGASEWGSRERMPEKLSARRWGVRDGSRLTNVMQNTLTKAEGRAPGSTSHPRVAVEASCGLAKMGILATPLAPRHHLVQVGCAAALPVPGVVAPGEPRVGAALPLAAARMEAVEPRSPADEQCLDEEDGTRAWMI